MTQRIQHKNDNSRIYEALWAKVSIASPTIWPTYSFVKNYYGKKILEIGPGKIPRAPILGTYFLDPVPEVVKALNERGGKGIVGTIEQMPFPDKEFDLILAFEVLEHIQDDTVAMKQLHRALKDDGIALVATQLHQRWFTDADLRVGHVRRYNPAQLLEKIQSAGFMLKQFSVSGTMSFLYSKDWFRRMVGRFGDTETLSRGASLFVPLLALVERTCGTVWYPADRYAEKTKDRAGVVMLLRKAL